MKYAIILRTFEDNDQRFIVLTHDVGVCTVTVGKPQKMGRPFLGALIAYRENKQKKRIWLVDIIAQPEEWVSVNFLHHVLHVIMRITAPYDPAPELFRYLLQLYQPSTASVELMTAFMEKLLDFSGEGKTEQRALMLPGIEGMFEKT